VEVLSKLYPAKSAERLKERGRTKKEDKKMEESKEKDVLIIMCEFKRKQLFTLNRVSP